MFCWIDYVCQAVKWLKSTLEDGKIKNKKKKKKISDAWQKSRWVGACNPCGIALIGRFLLMPRTSRLKTVNVWTDPSNTICFYSPIRSNRWRWTFAQSINGQERPYEGQQIAQAKQSMPKIINWNIFLS